MSELPQYTKLTRSIDIKKLISNLPANYAFVLATKLSCSEEYIRQILPPRLKNKPQKINDKVIEAAILLAEEEAKRIEILKEKFNRLND